MSSLDVSVRDDATGREITRSGNLASAAGPVSALVVAEVVRGDAGWRVEFTGRGYDAGLDAAMQQAGSRL